MIFFCLYDKIVKYTVAFYFEVRIQMKFITTLTEWVNRTFNGAKAFVNGVGNSVAQLAKSTHARVKTNYKDLSTKILPPKTTSVPALPAAQDTKAIEAVQSVAIYGLGNKHEFSLKGKVFHLLYNIGFDVEYAAVKFGRNMKVLFMVAGDLFKEYSQKAGSRSSEVVMGVLSEFAHPFVTAIRAIKTVVTISVDERHFGFVHVITHISSYINTGIKKHARLSTRPLNYILPIAAAAVFFYTSSTIFSYTYVLEVSNGDTSLGYVANETVVDTATQVVSDRISYNEFDTEWSIEPTYQLAVSEAIEQEVLTQEPLELANNIILNSGADIQEGTGLYIDGEFYGATINRDRLENDVSSVLAPYETDNPSITVDFIQDVQMQSGLYLQSSVVDYEELNNLITGTKGRTATNYVFAETDTVDYIISKFGMTHEELQSLNPSVDLDDIEGGDNIVIMKDEPVLGVKEIEEIVFEEEIMYDTVQIKSPDEQLGVIKTTVEGEVGVNRVTASITRIDGVQTGYEITSTEVLKEPVNEELVIGTAYGNTGLVYDGTSGSTAMQWPTGGGVSISRGWLGLYVHNGIDIAGPAGTPIYAADGGVVTFVNYGGSGYGTHLIIDHGNGIQTLYAHNSELYVSVGETVGRGQVVAGMGSTGWSTGNHLHFEVRLGGTAVPPEPYIM